MRSKGLILVICPVQEGDDLRAEAVVIGAELVVARQVYALRRRKRKAVAEDEVYRAGDLDPAAYRDV